jgi:hypothetical protein
MDIEGNKVELKPMPKFEKMQRIQARKSWITVGIRNAFIPYLRSA